MDPVTQGVLGAIVTQVRAQPIQLAKAACIGAAAGMAADLDVLIRSSTDPLLALQFHRHFTHSLLFIPLGALICSLVLHPLLGKRWQLDPRTTYLWCLLGYATHALLDSCTTYGTQLFWPLTNERYAWDIVSVVDPLFTLPILLMVILALRRQAKIFTYAGIIWGALYLGVGAVQHDRALVVAQQLAAERGHQPTRIEVKPSFANLVVWKSIYETEHHFYVDAVRPGWKNAKIWNGDNIEKLNVEQDFPWLESHYQQAKDIQRFYWFSAGYLAIDPNNPLGVVDVRYSMVPNSIEPLWGIRLSTSKTPEKHVEYYVQRNGSASAFATLKSMIID